MIAAIVEWPFFSMMLLFPEPYTQHYGYLGLPVELHCAGLTMTSDPHFTQIAWSKCSDCGEKWTELANIDIVNSVARVYPESHVSLGERRRISQDTGNLIINNLQQDDEGLYRCDPTGPDIVQIRLTIYGRLCDSIVQVVNIHIFHNTVSLTSSLFT